MTRLLLALCGLALALAASVQLAGETRYVLHGRQPLSKLLTAGAKEPAGVIFVFQPRDCLSSGGLIVAWNSLYREGSVPVRGMVVGNGSLSERQQRVVDDLHLSMPVRGISPEDAATVGEKLGYPATPFAVVLDTSGRVTASFPAEKNVPAATLHQLVYGL